RSMAAAPLATASVLASGTAVRAMVPRSVRAPVPARSRAPSSPRRPARSSTARANDSSPSPPADRHRSFRNGHRGEQGACGSRDPRLSLLRLILNPLHTPYVEELVGVLAPRPGGGSGEHRLSADRVYARLSCRGAPDGLRRRGGPQA